MARQRQCSCATNKTVHYLRDWQCRWSAAAHKLQAAGRPVQKNGKTIVANLAALFASLWINSQLITILQAPQRILSTTLAFLHA
jgi:hypothetical protein